MGQPNFNLWQLAEIAAEQKARLAKAEEAVRQGIRPFRIAEDFQGDFWPDEENLDEFLAPVSA